MYWRDAYFHDSPEKQLDCLHSVLDRMPYHIAVCDTEGALLYANESYLALHEVFGISLEELKHTNAFELVDHGYINRSGIVAVLKSKKPEAQIIVTKDNRDAYSYSAPIFDHDGDLKFIFNFSEFKEARSLFVKEVEIKLLEEQERAQGYRQALNFISMKQGYASKEIVVGCTAMQHIYDQALMVSKTGCNVVIYGESGTGKDVLATYIHENSPKRKEYPFIPVNCAAIPHELIESEFFGYERGAFTGANKSGKPGLFEIADKGTLFLNEIGELSLPLQAKLLSAVETGQITRLGGTQPKETNIHLIAATNRKLFEMVEQKTFREDLYYRLNVMSIYMPPLRERKDEIEALAVHFLNECNKRYSFQKIFSSQAIAALQEYHYPGNVRELRNIVERLAIVSNGAVIHLDGPLNSDLSSKSLTGPRQENSQNHVSFEGTLSEAAREFEKRYIQSAIRACNGNMTKAAEQLGTHRSVLYRKLGSG